MALYRLAVKNLNQKLFSSSSLVGERAFGSKWGQEHHEVVKRFATSASAPEKVVGSDQKQQTHEGTKEVAVSEGGKKFKLFPRRRGKNWKGLSFWKNKNTDHHLPTPYELFPPALGNALLQATENINKLFENVNLIPFPSQLMGRVKEQDDCYKLRFDVPGLAKDDVKITVSDGVLTIKGEHKEEEEEESDDEYWSAKRYGYYNTSMVLPEDAIGDEIKAELKDGVLNIIVPRNEKMRKDVKEVKIE